MIRSFSNFCRKGRHQYQHGYHTSICNPYTSISRSQLFSSPLKGLTGLQTVTSPNLETNPCRNTWKFSAANFHTICNTSRTLMTTSISGRNISTLMLSGRQPASRKLTKLKALSTVEGPGFVNFPHFCNILERGGVRTDGIVTEQTSAKTKTQQQINILTLKSTQNKHAPLPALRCTNQYGLSCHQSSMYIGKGSLLRPCHNMQTSLISELKTIDSFAFKTKRTIRRFTKNSKDIGGEVKGASWKDFNVKMKRFPLSSEFMSSLGICVAFTTIVALPTILNSMKKSDNQYDELEVEDAIHGRMVAVSKELEPELHKFLNVVLDKGDDNGKSRIIGNAAEIIVDVLNSEALQNAIASLVSRVIASQQFQTACHKLIKALWDDLIQDPETTAQVVQLLNTAIHDEKINNSFKELILGLLKDKEIYNELTRLVVILAEENEVLDATRSLLTESAHNALNDPEILDHSMDFAADVVGDDVVQRTSGMALRNTVTYAVSPSLSTFLSVFGGLLVLFSLSAIGNARSSAREGKEIDVAASVVARNVGTIILQSLTKVFTFPQRIVSASFYAVIGVMALPFKWLANMMTSMGTTKVLRNSINQVISTSFQSIISLLQRVGSILRSVAGGVAGNSTCFLKNCGVFLSEVVNKSKGLDIRSLFYQVMVAMRTFFSTHFGFH